MSEFPQLLPLERVHTDASLHSLCSLLQTAHVAAVVIVDYPNNTTHFDTYALGILCQHQSILDLDSGPYQVKRCVDALSTAVHTPDVETAKNLIYTTVCDILHKISSEFVAPALHTSDIPRHIHMKHGISLHVHDSFANKLLVDCITLLDSIVRIPTDQTAGCLPDYSALTSMMNVLSNTRVLDFVPSNVNQTITLVTKVWNEVTSSPVKPPVRLLQFCCHLFESILKNNRLFCDFS
jgi:hypothetical protein